MDYIVIGDFNSFSLQQRGDTFLCNVLGEARLVVSNGVESGRPQAESGRVCKQRVLGVSPSLV